MLAIRLSNLIEGSGTFAMPFFTEKATLSMRATFKSSPIDKTLITSALSNITEISSKENDKLVAYSPATLSAS